MRSDNTLSNLLTVLTQRESANVCTVCIIALCGRSFATEIYNKPKFPLPTNSISSLKWALPGKWTVLEWMPFNNFPWVEACL